MLIHAYYSQNYAGIIYLSLIKVLEYIIFIILLTIFNIVASVSSEENGMQPTTFHTQEPLSQCPPWFLYNATTDRCECYSNPSISEALKCTKKLRSYVENWVLHNV